MDDPILREALSFMNRLLGLRKADRRRKEWLLALFRSWHVELFGSLVLGAVGYFLALWIRWSGDVPAHLWKQIPYAALAGLVGLVVGGTLVDLWGQQRSWVAVSYSAFVASALSVLFAMASVYAVRVDAIPRLTFAVALGLLWAGLASWKWIVLRVRFAGLSHIGAASLGAENTQREVGAAEFPELFRRAGVLRDGLVVLPQR